MAGAGKGVNVMEQYKRKKITIM